MKADCTGKAYCKNRYPRVKKKKKDRNKYYVNEQKKKTNVRCVVRRFYET